MQTLEIIRPDDWHLHLRDGKMLKSVLLHTASKFGRALIMPNLNPPVLKVADALEYEKSINKYHSTKFKPFMALYLTEQTSLAEIDLASRTQSILSYKLYPSGATTNSSAGVRSIKNIMPQLERMAKHDIVLCIHGEVVDSEVDIFDREKIFIDEDLSLIRREFPELRIVLEHISTKEGVDFVNESSSKIAASITAHHLLENRNSIFKGGINPHYYCLPVLKRKYHQNALIKAAISGSSNFFAGTDSAPHLKVDKETSCGCAGIYTSHAAIELYAEVFDNYNSLDKLEQFMSVNGASFYGLLPNTDHIILEKEAWEVPASYFNDSVVPYRANNTVIWKIKQ